MKPAASVKVLRVGSLKIHVRRYGDGRFGFDHSSPAGARVKVRVKDETEAIRRANEMLTEGRAGKVERWIPEEEYMELLQLRAQRKLSAPVPGLVTAFLDSRRRKGVTSATVRAVSATLTPFAEAFPIPVADLSARAVEQWLDAKAKAPRTWNNMRANIVALVRYARRDGLLPAELTPVEKIEPRKVRVIVQTYTPAELEALLSVVPREWLPFIVLGAFCGLRPAEIAADQRGGGWKPSLRWENINWDKRKVDVPAEVSKVRKRRFVPICDAALAYLADWRKATGVIQPFKHVHLYTKVWGEKAGCGWKPDALRHSYASYRLALTHDLPALALEMGNSPAMIHRHYLDLKHEDEAAAWFALRPSAPANVHRLSA